MPKNFWEGQVDPDMSFTETQAYLRPRTPSALKQELFESLAPVEPPPADPEPGSDTLLQEHDIDPVEFAHRALQRPEMWDSADVQFLQDVLEGAEANEDLERLAEEYLSGRAHDRAAAAAGGPPPPVDEEDLGGPGEVFDDHIHELEEEIVPISLSVSTDPEPMDLSKVDEWWKK